MLQAHEVRPGDELDTDWTLHVDWGEEQRLREKRNELIRAQLMEGKTAAYRQSGWSLHPRVHSNDLCMYIPVRFEDQVSADDVVFCIVQPKGYYYAHLVHSKAWDDSCYKYKFWISSLKRKINGYCDIEGIFGKLVHAVH